MRAIVPAVGALLAAVALLMVGNGTLRSLISLRMAESDTNPIIIGVVAAAFFAGLTAGSLLAYKLILRVGHIRAFAAFSAVLSALCLVHGLAYDSLLWMVLRFCAGYSVAGLFMCIESWFNSQADNANRGSILGLYTMVLYSAEGGGQLLLNLQDDGPMLFMLLSMLITLGLVPVALTRTSPPTLPDVKSFSFRRLYEISPLGFLGAFFAGLVSGAFHGLAPVFGGQTGLSVAEISTMLFAAIVGGVLLQWPLGRLSDRFDRRRVIVALSAGLIVASLAMAITTIGQPIFLMIVALAYGGIAFSLYPLCVAHTNDHMDSRDLVSASGGLILAFSVGATIGPFLASILMTLFGPVGLFLFSAATGVAATAFGVFRMFARPPVPADAQAPFQAVPQTTPVAGPLDPRGEEDQLALDLTGTTEVKSS